MLFRSYRVIFDGLKDCNRSQFDEAQADVFGFSQLLLPAFREKYRRDRLRFSYGEKDRVFLGLVGQCVEGAMIAILALYLVSGVGGVPTGYSSHPSPDMRARALCDVVQVLVDAIIAETSEPDLGPRGPGYFDRIKNMPDIFYQIYKITESIIDRSMQGKIVDLG